MELADPIAAGPGGIDAVAAILRTGGAGLKDHADAIATALSVFIALTRSTVLWAVATGLTGCAEAIFAKRQALSAVLGAACAVFVR